eukprot:CAMPEP_0181318668 /NCGR_PEP_ID=MMETSP1101-20121128/17132_1 /TAXON_ID=46948 /ORGANISM="Rhodomonas abbreviata, Strain Caron Lab Isolate" /LENGTH=107 /DNA_ID=CAMNT_0023426159 /DNA_START=59 /DNA_END=382 /DNA_ORIENTATION=+
MADAIFKQIADGLADPANKDKAKKINGVFAWSIGGKDYFIDMKKDLTAGSGKPAGKADVTLTMAEKDFLDLMSGKAQGQTLFMSGKVKFKGNMGMVMKLQQVQQLLK